MSSKVSQFIQIETAAELIKAGDLVAFPTETVYGIGANARDDEACKKIYQLKGRPSNNPLIVHVSSLEEAKSIAKFDATAESLASHFWPGPLTLVLPLQHNANLANSVTAGLNTVAIRIPSHPVALELIRLSRTHIAAPSANPSGYISASLEEHVTKHFPGLFVLPDIMSGPIGLESTILDLSSAKPCILRYGFITPEVIADIIGQNVEYLTDQTIKAPGMLSKHYSPRASIRLNAISTEQGEQGIGFGDIDIGRLNLSKSGDLIEVAKNLYTMLRILDDAEDTTSIAIAPIPNAGIGLAINDRLMRAAK